MKLLFLLPVASVSSISIRGDLLTAASLWANDVGHVTAFLDEAASISADAFQSRAAAALAFEKEELMFKATLDQALVGNTLIQGANQTLVEQGTFQMVVDLLQDMVDQGIAGIGDVDRINKVRCASVLPSIDVYFREAAALSPGAQPIVAPRPDGCSRLR